MSKITKKELETIEYAAHIKRQMGWYLTGNRIHKMRVIHRLEAKGMLRSVGQVVMQDDDGFFFEPERCAEGWELTEEGTAAVEGSRR